MKNVYIYLFTLLPIFLFAQRPSFSGGDFRKGNASQHIGVVSGKLVDAEDGSSLPFANVRMFRFNDVLLEGTITDEEGFFEFNKLALANGYLLINYIGYEEKRVEISLNKNKKIEYLGKVKVARSAVNINEVSIEEEKPIYEAKMEKIIYNAENDLNESLDDATDVLRKTPLLSVDMDGNVSLRGSQNVKFLVNGKESTFFSGSPSDALKMIPADEIKSIEVITSPTAKYEGEGDAGIINIITKRKQILGFNATVNGSVGTRVNRQSFNLNIGKGKFGISSRAMVRYGWKLPGQGFSFRDNFNNQTTLIQINSTKGQWIGFGGNTEVYYDINPYNSIISNISYRGNKQTRENWSQDSLYLNDFGLEGKNQITLFIDSIRDLGMIEVNRYTDSENFKNSYEWTTDYVKKFSDHEDRELSIAFQLGLDIRDDDTYVLTNQEQDTVWNRNDASPITTVIQLDYVHPIQDKHSVEVGAKYINRDMISQYSTWNEGTFSQPYEQFDYNQKVTAAYLSTKWELNKKWGMVAGLRGEHTQISGQWNEQLSGGWVQNEKDTFQNDYLTILPNLILSYKIDMMQSLKFSYSKRLSRPGIYYINTNSIANDDLNIENGNPYLKPSTSHNLEIGYNNFSGKYKGSYYLFAKHSTNLIEPIVTINGDTAITNYQNLSENNSFGINYYGSISFKNLDLRAGFNLYTFQTTRESLGRVLYNWNTGGNYDLGKGYKIETWGFFRSPTATSQGYIPSFSMFSIGAKKEFNNKKGSLGVRIIQPFKQFKSFETEVNGDGFYSYSKNETLFRSIGISFKYSFGEMKFKAIKSKTNISNDDLMQGGEGEGEY